MGEEFRHELLDCGRATCSNSRPSTSSAPTSKTKNGICRASNVEEGFASCLESSRIAGRLSANAGGILADWGVDMIPKCSLSARDNGKERTSISEGVRPCTQEGGRRPVTQDSSCRLNKKGHGRWHAVEG